ncbi:MAG: hypothetical protein KOO61_03060 [Spirochaetales bacterium]|nr:hypothetical protein [Spirochaetales bacterium]
MRRLLSVALFTVSAAIAHAHLPPRDIAVPESQVKDVFFGYVVGILLQDEPLDVNGENLLAMFPEFADGSGQVPFHEMTRMVRTPGSRGAEITLELKDQLNYPVPVDILGYHPGMVISSPRLVFDEREYVPSDRDFGAVWLEWLRDGELAIDFDGWLDVLLGSWVDDVNVQLLAVAEYQSRWYILLGGDTPGGGWITGVYDLQSSRIVVRPPPALRLLGAELAGAGPRVSHSETRDE